MAGQFKGVNGRFKFTPPPSEARSERSEVVRTYVGSFPKIKCWGLSEMVFVGVEGHGGPI